MIRSPRSASCTQIAQPVRSDDEGVNGLESLGIDERGEAGELRELPNELPRLRCHDRFALPRSTTLGDFSRSGKDHDQPGRNLARSYKPFPGSIALLLTEALQVRAASEWETSDPAWLQLLVHRIETFVLDRHRRQMPTCKLTSLEWPHPFTAGRCPKLGISSPDGSPSGNFIARSIAWKGDSLRIGSRSGVVFMRSRIRVAQARLSTAMLSVAQCVEYDFASRQRPQTLQHLVGLSSVS